MPTHQWASPATSGRLVQWQRSFTARYRQDPQFRRTTIFAIVAAVVVAIIAGNVIGDQSRKHAIERKWYEMGYTDGKSAAKLVHQGMTPHDACSTAVEMEVTFRDMPGSLVPEGEVDWTALMKGCNHALADAGLN